MNNKKYWHWHFGLCIYACVHNTHYVYVIYSIEYLYLCTYWCVKSKKLIVVDTHTPVLAFFFLLFYIANVIRNKHTHTYVIVDYRVNILHYMCVGGGGYLFIVIFISMYIHKYIYYIISFIDKDTLYVHDYTYIASLLRMFISELINQFIN